MQGEVVARAAPTLLLVRHGAIAGLGMAPMQLMAVTAEPALLDAAAVKAGDRVRLAVRPRGDDTMLLRIERLP